MTDITFSIVICTHRRPNLLEGAVRSLIQQGASPNIYEVIVVDNDAENNTDVKEVVEKADKHISIRYLREKRIGLSYARNAGGKAANSDLIVYLDDDARDNPQYVESLIRIVQEHNPDICGGPVSPFYLSPKPSWFLDKYGSFTKGTVARYLNSKEYLQGGNIVFRRSLLEEVGWFDPNVGLKGKKRSYGEETLVMIKAWRRFPDLRVYYDPRLIAYHLVPAWKMSVKNLMRIAYWHGKSQAYFWIPQEQVHNSRLVSPFNLVFGLSYLHYKLFKGILLRNRQSYPYWQNLIVEDMYPSVESIGVQTQLFHDLLFGLIRKGDG